MAFIPIGVSRVPFALNQLLAQDNLRIRQQALTATSQEVSSGRRINLPSDDPAGAVRATVLQSLKNQNEQFRANVQFGSTSLGVTQKALESVNDGINQAKQIALRNDTTLLSQAERTGDIAAVDGIIDSLIRTGNQQYLGQSIFAGQRLDSTPFQREGNFVRFFGDQGPLSSLSNSHDLFDLNLTPGSSIGTDSTAGRGTVDLNPEITSATRLSELNRGQGISKGTIEVSVGGPAVAVDLSQADTVGDVLAAINGAVGPGTATIAPSGNGIRLAGAGPVTVVDPGSGTTALELGLRVGGATAPFDGGDLDPRVTVTTPVSALSLPGPLGTLQIQNGPYSAAVDLSTANTVEDVLNAINGANVRVRAEINTAGTGIDVVNVLAGSAFTITGTTAQALGIATTTDSTPLADFNDRAGVGTGTGPDLLVTARDGTTFQIDLDDGAFTDKTVGGFLAYFASKTGGKVTGAVDPSGGIRLTDTTGGAGNLVVTNVNYSPSAKDLGIDTGPAGVASATFLGTNRHEARVHGVFDSLIRLRNGLQNGDLREIGLAARQLDDDADRTSAAVGSVASRQQVLEQLADRLGNEITQNQGDAANILEPDLADAATRLVNQQTALQAALNATSRLLERSLLDFLS